MVEFRLFGIPVRVEPAFWFTIGIIGFLYTSNSPHNALLMMALFVLAAFVSILVHEMGHALAIKFFKYPTRVVLSSFGGYATFPPNVLSRMQSFLVTLAGPAVQLALGLSILYFVPAINKFTPEGAMINYFFLYLMGVSIIWSLFNLMPIFPMDGGHLLAAILGPKRQKLVFIIGIVIACGLGCLALFQYKEIYIAMFMGLFAYQNFQLLKQLKNWRG
ncbi:site-2 protease family protein [Persicirhabdus sediminis]|uniref:Site-2 protease family protein n=1 Tax=Persicirhabdus sediminis TaxID=454144 RepID=A0A8J7MBA0_9BACT|nr:site-2 protease family protein [Persicirhabdus sediminis]MBK1789942.1 site-2 protease family protein [Persicirhabdus sediminis]